MIETTDFNKSEQYTLSIRLSTDGFSFSVFNPLDEKGFSCEDYAINEELPLTANLKEAFAQKAWLTRPFRRVNVLVADKRFTLMPLEFFKEELAETVFYHNHPRHNNETVLYNIRQRNNLAILFTLDQSAHNFLRQQYPNVYFYSQASPLSDFFASKSRLGNSRKMYVHLRREAMDVFCFEYGRLMLGNCLQCSVTADRLYYLLYLWKTLGFDQERDEMHLTGYLADKEQLLPELQKFIRQVFIMNPASNLDLQAITTCE